MSKESGTKIVGGMILLGGLFVIICMMVAYYTYEKDKVGSGIFMLAASLPISAILYGVFKKR